MRKLCLWFVLAGTALATGAVDAAELVRANEYHLGPEETLASDLLVAAQVIVIDGVIQGDVLAVGKHVEINGEVQGDIKAAAAELIIRGTAVQDVHLSAANATLSGQFVDDVFVVAGNVDVLETFRCGDDLHVAAGETAIEGDVRGDLFAAAGTLRMRGAVGADTYLAAATLDVSPATEIDGTLYYMTGEPVEMPEGVAGHVLFREPPDHEEPPLSFRILGWVVRTLLVLAGFAFVTVALRMFAPSAVLKPAGVLRVAPGRSLLWGLAVALLFLWVPIASVLLLLLTLLFWGVLPALVLASLLIGLAGCLWVWSPLVTGHWLGRLTGGGHRMSLTAALTGVLLVALLGRIPVVGWLIYLASFLLALGAVVRVPRSRAAEPGESASVSEF